MMKNEITFKNHWTQKKNESGKIYNIPLKKRISAEIDEYEAQRDN
jgi:hypothetical protein